MIIFNKNPNYLFRKIIKIFLDLILNFMQFNFQEHKVFIINKHFNPQKSPIITWCQRQSPMMQHFKIAVNACKINKLEHI